MDLKLKMMLQIIFGDSDTNEDNHKLFWWNVYHQIIGTEVVPETTSVPRGDFVNDYIYFKYLSLKHEIFPTQYVLCIQFKTFFFPFRK